MSQDACRNIKSSETNYPVSDGPEENGNVKDDRTSSQAVKLAEDPKTGQEQAESNVPGQEKILKKPDKILPCPRCKSMATKFCYYNNYNVNQPRHFCKNCQRYWTAGGTMRNVPVGAGRRKNKHCAMHQRNMAMLSDGVEATQADASDSTHRLSVSVLKFGPEAPHCESMSSVLNLGDQKGTSESSSMACGDTIDEPSCSSSVTAPNCVGKEVPEIGMNVKQSGMQDSPCGANPMQHFLFYPGPAWAYPWSTPMITAPAFCAPAIPLLFIPPPFWGCMANTPCAAWNVPWVGNYNGLSRSSSTTDCACSCNGSPTLGKHSRDASFHQEEKTEKSLWFPKTLRIDDPDEAAKSSIWTTLGIKPDEGGIFKAFRSKAENKDQLSDAAQVLHANPAALSRSQSFHENA